MYQSDEIKDLGKIGFLTATRFLEKIGLGTVVSIKDWENRISHCDKIKEFLEKIGFFTATRLKNFWEK